MIDIVILNRNLRLHDNAALYYGSLNSNYIVIHLYDENYWKANGRSVRQLKFSYECLQELDDNLKKIGSEINIFEGSFDDLNKWIKINFNDCCIHINHCTDIDYFRKGFEKFKQEFGDGLKVYDDFGKGTPQTVNEKLCEVRREFEKYNLISGLHTFYKKKESIYENLLPPLRV